MHQDPEHEDYDDDEYKYYPQEYNDYGYPKAFSIDWAAWEQWLAKAVSEIQEDSDNNVWIFSTKQKFPVSDLHQDTSKNKYFMYLGSNHHNDPIWKSNYFAKDEIDMMYKNHIASNPVNFLKNPTYYKGLHDILN